ncbi:MAG: DNA-binding response regulator [Anaerolineales bacterium]
MNTKVILLADNNEDFLDSRAEFLKKEGFVVLKAPSPQKARDILGQKRVNLAVLDIRLTDDTEGDISGLDLALDPAFVSLPKIMMTGFPNVEDAKRSLKPFIGNLPPAIDYISKKGTGDAAGRKEFIEAVKLAFNEQVRINTNLVIEWDTRDRLSFYQLSRLIYVNMPDEVLLQRAEELEDLVRELFFDYQRIRLGRLLWHAREQFCLPVLTQSNEMTTDLRILVCGDRDNRKRQQEHNNVLAPDVLQRTELRDTEETIHFGANLYELRGASTDSVQTFRDLFHGGREKPLKMALAHLLNDVLAPWHQHGQMVDEASDLRSAYRQWVGLTGAGLSQPDVETAVRKLLQSVSTLESINIEWNGETVVFRFPDGSVHNLANPVSSVYNTSGQLDPLTVCRISPGMLTADNILIDSKSRVWLTDFGHASQAPQWWDFICLEAALRFELSHAPDLLAWQDYEECLIKPSRLDEGLEETNVIPDLRLSVGLIEQIRRQAATEAGVETLPYYAGLLAWIVEAMVHYDPGVLYTEDRLRGAHLLLAACMIAKRFTTLHEASQSGGMLRLDEDGRVWIGERRVAVLMGLRLKLLRYLIEQQGRIVGNEAITTNVYGEEYFPGNEDQNQRIRQEISRIRDDVEPNPSRPSYILTERGKGYRLNLMGEMEK